MKAFQMARHTLESPGNYRSTSSLPMKIVLLIRDTIAAFGRHDGTILAAAIAYYTLLSVFPLVLGLVALLGLVISDPARRGDLVASIANLFPGANDLIQQTVSDVVRGRQAAGMVATAGLLWSASGVFGGISRALDRIWGVQEWRHVVLSALLAIGLVLAVGVIFVLSLALSAALRLAESANLPILGISLGSLPLLFPL